VDTAVTDDEVMAIFTEHRNVETLAVVDAGVPIGLINRNAFHESYVKPFAREVFGRRSCMEPWGRGSRIPPTSWPRSTRT